MRAFLGVVGIATLAAVAVAGCSGAGPTTKAGGQAVVALRMADGYSRLEYQPAVKYFVDEVRRRSDGVLRVDVRHSWGGYLPDFESRTVAAVASGEVDLAWVGTRSFDTMGVHSFEALTAPLLVDSYPLQAAVLRSELPRRMLPALNGLGISPLALLAGGLRRPIAVDRPLLRPDDWRGMTFSAFRSESQAATVRALGALHTDVFANDLAAGLAAGTIGGFEKNLLAYSMNGGMERVAPHVAANVTLWPETVVLVVNPRRLGRLTARQAGWLRGAASDAAARSAAMADVDQGLVAASCGKGARFAVASTADLAALRAAVESVYSRLEQDPSTRAHIARIRELKQATAAPADLAIPPGCEDTAPKPVTTPSGPSAPASPLIGTWRTGDIRPERVSAVYERAGGSPAEATAFVDGLGTGSPEHRVRFEIRITATSWNLYEQTDNGSMALGWTGTYSLDGSTVHAADAEATACRIDYALAWTGNQISITVLRDVGDRPDCGHEDLLAQRAIYESAPFIRV
jgi:TRAP-type transport system periplasmic protein